MSKLLKSKFLLGVMLVAVMFVGVSFAAKTAKASAADCTISMTLRKGMSNSQVKCLQQKLNAAGFTVSASGAGSEGYENNSFGTKTLAAVKAFQTANQLKADGIFGAISRAALTVAAPVVSTTTTTTTTTTATTSTFPAGCSSATGFSTTTGASCASGVVSTFPAGCSSATGFSSTTGASCATGTTTTTTTVSSGALSVALASDTPVTRSLVIDTNPNPDLGEAGADLAHFTFTGTGTVTAMNLQRFGISADSDLNNVYLYDGATRITDGSSVTTGGNVNFNNPAGLFTVAGTKTISVRADIGAATSGESIGMKLVSFMKKDDTAVTVAGISGNSFSTATSANLASITFTNGNNTNPSLNGNLNPGTDITVWGTYTLSVGKDAWLNRLALREVGSIALTDIKNFRLYVDGTVVGAAVPALDANGYVTFDLSAAPLKLLSGSRTFKVVADVVGGSNRTFTFNLRSVADLGITDNQYGVGLTLDTSVNAKPTAGMQTITPGSITVQKDVSSPSGNVTLNGSNVTLGKFTFTVYGEPVKIDTLNVQVVYTAVGGAAVGSLRNGHILVNGAQYGSTQNILTAGSTPFTVSTTLPVGINTVEIIADVYDSDGVPTLAATDLLKAQLNIGANNNAQGTVSGVQSTVPAIITPANTVTVQAGSLALAKTTSYPNQTSVVPQTNYKLASFQLTGNSTEAVNLNTIGVDFSAQTGATFDATDLTNVKIMYNGVAEANVKPTVSTVANANTWSVSHTLAANATAQIDVYADVGTAITTGDAIVTKLDVTGVTASSSQTLYTLVGGNSNTVGPAAAFPGQIVTAAAGTISSGLDASSPVARNMFDQTTNTIGAFKWTSTNDTYNLTDVTFTLGNATSVTSVNLKDGNTILATMPGASTVTFTGLNNGQGVPIASTTKILTLEAVLGTIGVNNGSSNEAVTATLTSYKTTSSTGTQATANVNIPAATSYAFAAIPTITQLALPSTVGINGTPTLDKFSIASNGGTIGWNKLVFTTTTTAPIVITLPTLWNYDSNTTIGGSWTILGVSNHATCDAADVSCTFTFVPTNEQQVSLPVNYAFQVTATGAVVNTDNLQTKIAAPSIANAAGTHAFAYIDVNNNGLVDANDIRYAPTLQVTAAVAQTNTGVTTIAGGNAKEADSFGTFTDQQHVILTETGIATNTIGAITGSLVTVGGFTCNAYTGADGTLLVTTTVANILSIKCTNGTDNQIVINTAAVAPDNANVQVSDFTLTKAANYAVGTAVAATDSDVNLTIQDNPSFIWSDISAAGHTVGTLDWYNDFLIKNLPLATANMAQ